MISRYHSLLHRRGLDGTLVVAKTNTALSGDVRRWCLLLIYVWVYWQGFVA